MRNIFKSDPNYPTDPGRKLATFGILIVVVPLLLVLGTKFYGTGRININVPNNKQPLTVKIFKQSSGEQVVLNNLQSANFSKLLPAGSYEVRIFSEDNKAASYLISVPRFFRTISTTSVILNQAGREKLARDVSNCPVLADGQLYSYTCGLSNVISRNMRLSAEKYSTRQDSSVSGIIAAEAYRDGILALRISEQTGSSITPVVSFIKNGVVVSNKTLPKSLAGTVQDNNPDFRLVIDRKNHDSFVVAKRAASFEIASFKSLESDAVVNKVEFASLALGRLASSVDLYNDQILIATGKPGAPAHEPEAKKDNDLATSIRIFNTKNPNATSADYKINEPISKVSFCGTDDVCILRDDKLTLYKKSSGRLSKRGSINQVDSFIRLNNTTAAYLQDNKIYKLNVDDLSATMLYGSDRFTVTDIFASENAIIVNTSLPSSTKQDITHTFQLNLNPAEINNFVDNKLPYDNDGSIWDMDYSGKTILTTLILNSSTLDRATGKIDFDQTEYNQVTKLLNERLSKDGFSSPEYTIKFIVSY